MRTRRKILVVASLALFLLLCGGYWLYPHLRAARGLCSIVSSLSDAKALVVEGRFIDDQTSSVTNISVRLTNRDDIAAIASLFQSATPRLDIPTTYEFSGGAKLATFFSGTVTVELAGTTNKIGFLGTDLIIGEGDTAVQLQGFSSPVIYHTLKQRGVL